MNLEGNSLQLTPHGGSGEINEFISPTAGVRGLLSHKAAVAIESESLQLKHRAAHSKRVFQPPGQSFPAWLVPVFSAGSRS